MLLELTSQVGLNSCCAPPMLSIMAHAQFPQQNKSSPELWMPSWAIFLPILQACVLVIAAHIDALTLWHAGADMTNAVIDRVDFRQANLSNVKFINAVITGTTFDGANLDGAVFEDALIGNEDVKRL